MHTDYVQAFGGAVKDGVLYVGGIVSGNLNSSDPEISASINTAVIYKYNFDNLNNRTLNFSNSRGIRTLYEMYPSFYDINNSPLNLSATTTIVNNRLTLIPNKLSTYFKQDNKINVFFSMSIFSSTLIPASFNDNTTINFRDNVGDNISNYGYRNDEALFVAPFEEKFQYNRMYNIGGYYLSNSNGLSFQSFFMSQSTIKIPYLDLTNDSVSMIFISSSMTGNYIIKDIELKFSIPLTSDGVRFYRDLNNANSNKILQNINPSIGKKVD